LPSATTRYSMSLSVTIPIGSSEFLSLTIIEDVFLLFINRVASAILASSYWVAKSLSIKSPTFWDNEFEYNYYQKDIV
jgi:hypothetical protein